MRRGGRGVVSGILLCRLRPRTQLPLVFLFLLFMQTGAMGRVTVPRTAFLQSLIGSLAHESKLLGADAIYATTSSTLHRHCVHGLHGWHRRHALCGQGRSIALGLMSWRLALLLLTLLLLFFPSVLCVDITVCDNANGWQRPYYRRLAINASWPCSAACAAPAIKVARRLPLRSTSQPCWPLCHLLSLLQL